MDGRASGPLGGPLSGSLVAPRGGHLSCHLSGPVPLAGAANHPGDRFGAIRWDEDRPERQDGQFVLRFAGQTVTKTVRLPPAPDRPGRTPRILATVRVKPVYTLVEGKLRPNDPWTRLGSVSVLVPPEEGGTPTEVELMRFITPYGGPATFVQEVTALAPLLSGETTFQLFLSTYSQEPGWRASFTLTYLDEEAGHRRPMLVVPLFNDAHVTGGPDGTARLAGTVDIPPGLARPRLQITTTGHATDGAGGNEFVSSDHLLRIDGRLVARWRPWSEAGGGLRPANPWSGREVVDGQEVWASDFDRSGWHPGTEVSPVLFPGAGAAARTTPDRARDPGHPPAGPHRSGRSRLLGGLGPGAGRRALAGGRGRRTLAAR